MKLKLIFGGRLASNCLNRRRLMMAKESQKSLLRIKRLQLKRLRLKLRTKTWVND
jgi:hypothetical protein